MAVCATASVLGGGLSVNNTAIGDCTSYVILTASDYAASVPSLTLNDTVQLCSGVILAWALAYSIRLLRNVL